jgi:hypothetical protein
MIRTIVPPLLAVKRLSRRKLAGATGLELAASCVTGRRSILTEAARSNVREKWRAERPGPRGNSGWPIDCVLEVRDRAQTRCNYLKSNGVGGRRLIRNDAGRYLLSSP